MKWRHAIKRAFEMAVWSFVPAFAIASHHAVWLKFVFLQEHHFVVARMDEPTLRTQNLWRQVDQHYGWLFIAAVLIPVVCSFVQHLDLRWWWRALIGITLCTPALAYTSLTLQLFGKLITSAP